MGLTIKKVCVMKKRLLFLFIVIMAMTACSKGDVNNKENVDSKPAIFHAAIETSPSKTYMDENWRLLWTEDDRVSIFTSSYNQQYVFTGKTGSNSGDFEEVKVSGFHFGSSLSANYAVYPYMEETRISNEEVLTLNLPAEQEYAMKSFGKGASTMVAVTSSPEDKYLYFKNLCGFLVLKLYGTGSVLNVSLKGGNGEKIAGKALVKASHSNDPQTTMEKDATERITINCGDFGVEVAESAQEATEFWFCVPPTTFSKGLSITVTGVNGQSIVKKISSSKTLLRNVIVSLPAVEIDFSTDASFSFTTNATRVAAPLVEGKNVSGIIRWGDGSGHVEYSANAVHEYTGKEQGKDHKIITTTSGGETLTLTTLEGVSAVDFRKF